tara:strand:- start:660 stop:830 length:171 start_codon:yes stop_codon:yes gene_type:complete
MSVENFLTFVVPSLASLAYASAGVAHFFITKNYPMSLMFACYAVANLALLTSTLRK